LIEWRHSTNTPGAGLKETGASGSGV
jgi:hypothetical protein